MIETKGVVHFSIPVSDPDRSEAFYRDMLGLKTISRAPPPLNFIFMTSGEDIIVLVQSKTPIDPNPDNERNVHHAFRIDIGAYEKSAAFLRENGVNIIHEEERVDGVFRGKQCHFHDPDRNVIEIIALTGIGP